MSFKKHWRAVVVVTTVAFATLLPATAVHAAPAEYIVVRGDTLSEIGNAVGVQWELIASENGIVAPYTIYPNQILRLPETGSVFAGSASRQLVKVLPKPEPVTPEVVAPDSVDLGVADRYGLRAPLNSRPARYAAAVIGPRFKIKNIGGAARSGHVPGSDHYAGHALDIMTNNIPDGMETGDGIVEYVLEHYDELNIKYIIWNKRIRNSNGKWSAYHGPSDHTDHVHLSFRNEEGR